ncbi:MAG: PQQ-dependent sugar dehydrogenase, partial [Acidobacteriota bacterium]
MRKTITLGMLLLLLAAAASATADVLPDKYRIEPVARGIEEAHGAAFAPDGRVFVLERLTGQVRVLRHGKLLATPFVTLPVATGAEEGLLGIALHPDFLRNGWVYLYYTQASPKTNRVVRYTANGDVGTSPVTIVDSIGSDVGGEDNGGGLVFGADGKLYVATGVFGVDADAQNMSSLAGKILRVNDDGTVPADNPNGGLTYPYNLIYAKGIRDSCDLAMHAGQGTLYGVDNYDSDAACDESEVLVADGDYGWSGASCGSEPLNPPLHSISPQVTAMGLESYTGGRYPGFEDNMFIAGNSGEILRDVLTGTAFDSFGSSHAFYDPTGDSDCPDQLTDVTQGRDGWLYAVSAESPVDNPGLYRVIFDDYGQTNARPREVSATQHIPLTVEKAGAGLDIFFEDLKLDVWGCTDGTTPAHCPTGSQSTSYTVWAGDLNSVSAYPHTVLAQTDGTDVSDALLSYNIDTMPEGNKYYLVSGRGANLEGTLGLASGGGDRPGYAETDLCGGSGIPLGTKLDTCAGGPDNLRPDQYNNMVRLSDF